MKNLSLLAGYCVAIFLCGLLITIFNPMSMKIILPRMGDLQFGRFWVLIYPGLVLLGIGYAYGIAKIGSFRTQRSLHSILIVACLVLFWIYTAPFGMLSPEFNNQAISFIWLVIGLAGLPLFVLGANFLLLQSWFSRTSNRAARDAYFLFAFHAAGAIVGLFLYPLFIEWMLPLRQQMRWWTIVFTGTAVLSMLCSWQTTHSATVEEKPSQRIGMVPKLRWCGIAAIPWLSSIVIASFAFNFGIHVESVSFSVWMIGPGLYQLSLVLAFAWRPRSLATRTTQYVIGLTAVSITALIALCALGLAIQYALTYACVFGIALFCHFILAADRPKVDHLPDYYLFLSIGRLPSL